MNLLIKVLYGILFVSYSMFSVLFFEDWNSNIIIPFFPILAMGTWLFGRTIGLILILAIGSIGLTLSQVYGDIYLYYAGRASGIATLICIALLIGTLRSRYDQIRELNRQLDQKVITRDTELNKLAKQLLWNAETRRMELGQELHDGIGQQLTGIQLLCSSLEYQLTNDDNRNSDLAKSLAARSGKIHNQIRGIARSLFPVRIAHVGLFSALNEMVSCYNDIQNAQMTVKEFSAMHNMPEALSLQLYRICQESCTYLLEYGSAKKIDIVLNTNKSSFIVGIEHDGSLPETKDTESLFGLIQYRLKRVKGKISYTKTNAGRSVVCFEMTKPEN